MASSNPRESMESNNLTPTALSPILSPTASNSQLSVADPPRSSSARPRRQRRLSDASSVVSFSSLGTTMDWRTSKDFGGGSVGTNPTAISALVDSPGQRPNAAARPRHGEIPRVTLTQIPKIKASAFAPYLAITPEYERYQRAKNAGLEEHLRLSRKDSDVLLEAGGEDTVTEDGTLKDGSVGKRRRRATLAETPISTVPQIYFDENFQLENPRTFDVVSEKSEIIQTVVPASDNDDQNAAQTQRKALATNAILQEKLSWYMDTVEVHLIKSISTASSSFFAALGDLQELHQEASTSVEKIQGLRQELVRLDEEQAIKGLEIVRLRRRRQNVAKLEKAVQQMQRVTQGVEKTEELLSEQDLDGALASVEETDRVMRGVGEGLIDLRGVDSLGAVTADLSHLRYRIGAGYESQFVDCLLSDIRRHIQSVPPEETLKRFAQSFQREQNYRYLLAKHDPNSSEPPPKSSSLPPEYAIMSEGLRGTLMQLLKGLKRANHINNAVQAYRDAVIKEAKKVIRRNLPSDDDADSVASSMSRASRFGGTRSSSDKSMALTRALRNLGPADAEDLYVRIYTGVSEMIRRLGTQQKMLLDVTMQMGETGVGGMLSPRFEQTTFMNGDSPNSTPSGESEPVRMDISDLISSAVDIAQSNIVKIVKVRSEQVAHYPRDQFLRYFVLNRLFAQECESVSVRVNSGLQNAIQAQIKEFLRIHHEERIGELQDSLDRDKWAAMEVTPEDQKGVDRIVKSAESDPEEWTSLALLWAIRTEENAVNRSALPAPSVPIVTKLRSNSAASLKSIRNGVTGLDLKPVLEGKSDNKETTESSSADQLRPPAANPSVNGSTDSIPVYKDGTPSNPTPEPFKPPTPAPAEPAKPAANSTRVTIASETFILPSSGLLVLTQLESYLRLVVLLPGFTSELSSHIIQLLNMFMSRTFQLIHGAGATKSLAQLKSITTRHLAIASQALSIIITLTGCIRECVRRHNPSAPASDFDRLKRTTQDYQSEIHGKLVSIMSDRARSHVNSIVRGIDWDAPQDKEGKYYMETLCKETGLLYKVMNKHLPKEQVLGIMVPVFRDYCTKLVEAYGQAVVRTEGGKQRMMDDAKTFQERLGGLDGAGNVPEIILEAVNNKVVQQGSAHPSRTGTPVQMTNGN